MSSKTGKEKPNQDCSRREFMKASALTAAAAGVLPLYGMAPDSAATKSRGSLYI